MKYFLVSNSVRDGNKPVTHLGLDSLNASVLTCCASLM